MAEESLDGQIIVHVRYLSPNRDFCYTKRLMAYARILSLPREKMKGASEHHL